MRQEEQESDLTLPLAMLATGGSSSLCFLAMYQYLQDRQARARRRKYALLLANLAALLAAELEADLEDEQEHFLAIEDGEAAQSETEDDEEPSSSEYESEEDYE
jgi:hypothetical protein